jgi:hypothetical protein
MDSSLSVVRIRAGISSSIVADEGGGICISSKVEVSHVVFVKGVGESEVGAVSGVSRGVLHSIESRHLCELRSTLNWLLGVNQFHAVVDNEHGVRLVNAVLGNDSSRKAVVFLASAVTSEDSESGISLRTHEVSDRRGYERVVVDSVTLQEVSFDGVADSLCHGGVESSNEISVLVGALGASIKVSNHFGEGVVDQEHLSLVETVGHFHTS